jgi:hypothetical protein
MSSDHHHQTSVPSKNVRYICIKHKISAVVHHDVSLETEKSHVTDVLQIVAPLESPAAIHSRIKLELNVQVGCHSFNFDL